MSDAATPKTDALNRRQNPWGNQYERAEREEWVALARRLERERDALRLQAKYHDEADALRKLRERERDEARAEVARLLAQDKETFTDAVALLNERDEARADAADAREKLADWENAAKQVDADHPDEVHCGCVPVLKGMVMFGRAKHVTAGKDLQALRLIAKDLRDALRGAMGEGPVAPPFKWQAFAEDGLELLRQWELKRKEKHDEL
jgi:hypothetical protein